MSSQVNSGQDKASYIFSLKYTVSGGHSLGSPRCICSIIQMKLICDRPRISSDYFCTCVCLCCLCVLRYVFRCTRIYLHVCHVDRPRPPPLFLCFMPALFARANSPLYFVVSWHIVLFLLCPMTHDPSPLSF